jgi:hypothetical protein
MLDSRTRRSDSDSDGAGGRVAPATPSSPPAWADPGPWWPVRGGARGLEATRCGGAGGAGRDAGSAAPLPPLALLTTCRAPQEQRTPLFLTAEAAAALQSPPPPNGCDGARLLISAKADVDLPSKVPSRPPARGRARVARAGIAPDTLARMLFSRDPARCPPSVFCDSDMMRRRSRGSESPRQRSWQSAFPNRAVLGSSPVVPDARLPLAKHSLSPPLAHAQAPRVDWEKR